MDHGICDRFLSLHRRAVSPIELRSCSDFEIAEVPSKQIDEIGMNRFVRLTVCMDLLKSLV